MTRRPRKISSWAALVAAATVCAAAAAQEAPAPEAIQIDTTSNLEPEAPAAAGIPPDALELRALRESEQGSRLSFVAGVDYVSQYTSRGLVFADEPSIQPWAELDVTIAADAQPDGPVDRVSWFAGTWNNINNNATPGLARTGRRRELSNWFEADVYTGVRVNFLDNAQASLRFNWYTSPSNSFDQIQEIDARLAYNDADFWAGRGLDGFSLTPRIRVAKETRDDGGSEQWYFEPSITPSAIIEALPLEPRISVPLVLGFGANGQYIELDTGDERTFGHFRTGLAAQVDLPFAPASRGSLSFRTALEVIVLADESLSIEREQVDEVFRFGFSYAY